MELRDIAFLEKLFLYHEDKNKITNIIQQGSRYHIYPIPTRIDIYSKVGSAQGGPGITPPPPPPPTRTYRDSGEAESEVREGAQVTKPTPLNRTDRDRGAVVSRVGGAQGGRTQADRLTGVAQDAVLEEAATLVGDRKRLTAEAELGQHRKKKIDWEDGGKRDIR